MKRVVALCCVIFAFSLFAADKPTQKKMSPEEEAMMKAWMEYATPGKGHKHFEKIVGSWSAKTKMWEDPSGPPSTGKGEVTAEVIFGGRYLVMRYKGEWNNMPFEGMGITGFDNAKKKYQTIWLDSMGTGLYYTEGTCNEEDTQCVEEGDWFDPIRKQNFKVKGVTTFPDQDHMVYEMFVTYPGKEPYKSMEIHYTRK